jgi:hypothetical protein
MLNIKNPYRITQNQYDTYNEGSQAGIIAALNWGEEKCTNPNHKGTRISWPEITKPLKRQCTQCMEKIKKEYGIQ